MSNKKPSTLRNAVIVVLFLLVYASAYLYLRKSDHYRYGHNKTSFTIFWNRANYVIFYPLHTLDKWITGRTPYYLPSVHSDD